MKFIDLFAGIGGFRLGMEMAGHECVGHCEIDKYANASYIAMHSPKESEWFEADITRVRADDIPRADCWCFGFPCQDISVAGKQGGFTRGKRSSLFFTVTGLIRNLEEKDRPTYLFIENVKNLLSINRGFDFAKILIELDEIGYDAEWQVLNSKHFGVPQNRERVFIIGHLRGRGGREVFPIGTANSAAAVKGINTKDLDGKETQQQDRIYDPNEVMTALTAGLHGRYNILQLPHGYNKGGMKDICPTITKNAFENNNFVVIGYNTMPDGTARTIKAQYSRNGASNFMRQDGYAATGALCRPLDASYHMGNGDYSPTLTEVMGKGGGQIPMIYHAVDDSVAHCLDASYHKGLLCRQKRTGVYDGARIRRLTPRECFRLQGFPDEYFERAAAVNSDTQLYKQAGNSVTVNVIYEIAKRLGKE